MWELGYVPIREGKGEQKVIYKIVLKLSSSSKGSILTTSSFSIMWRIFYSYNHLPLVQQHLYLHYWSQPPPSWSPSTSTWFFSILLPQLQHLQKLNWWFNNTSTTTTYSEDSGVVSRSLSVVSIISLLASIIFL